MISGCRVGGLGQGLGLFSVFHKHFRVQGFGVYMSEAVPTAANLLRQTFDAKRMFGTAQDFARCQSFMHFFGGETTSEFSINVNLWKNQV